jgi:hypothetical protein
MKAKSLFTLFLIILLFSFISCSDDDDQNDKNRLPDTAQAFIESRLPGYQILNIKDVDDKGDEMNERYIVTFSNDISVSFSSWGFWRHIKSSSELPELLLEVLPFNGAAEVRNTYPAVTINEINFTLYGYQAVTSIGIPIAFYDTNYSSTFGLDLTKEQSLWPQGAIEFISYFKSGEQPFFFIKEKDANDSEYRFGNSNGVKVHFDKKGNWYNYEGGGKPIANKLLYEALLPEEMREAIEQQYEGGASRIYAILRYDNYYQVSLKRSGNDLVSVLLDADTNQEVEPRTDAILDFLNTYGGEPAEDLVVSMKMVADTRQVVFHYTGKVDGANVFTLYTDVEDKVLYIDLNGTVIPDKVLTYLPTKVKEYAEKNHVGKEIMTVMNGLGDEFYILYKGGSRLYFDKDGNVAG